MDHLPTGAIYMKKMKKIKKEKIKRVDMAMQSHQNHTENENPFSKEVEVTE